MSENHQLFSLSDLFESINSDINITNQYSISRLFFKLLENKTVTLQNKKTEFEFSLKRNRFSEKKSIIIICSKDNSQILKYSLSKIKDNHIDEDHDILLVDDRSSSKDISDLSDLFQTSYLRIDNSDDYFNYSVINNIAASYAKKYYKDTLIFYNNDMWPNNNKTLPSIIEKHNKNKSGITGCKLVYPSQDHYIEIGKPQHLLNSHLEKIYNTIQHGGIHFFLKQANLIDPKRTYCSHSLALFPSHLWRFYENDNYMASLDQHCYSVTGALHIIDTEVFFKLNGLDPSLSSAFQDIDICIRALENQIPVFYVGTEFMYHAESLTNAKEQITMKPEFLSDNIMWEYLWSTKLPSILGLQYLL